MGKTYQLGVKVMVYEFERIPQEEIEKRIIYDFLKTIPLEDLKKLVNFKEINFNNKKLWNKNRETDEKLNQLRYENAVIFEGDYDPRWQTY